MSTLRTIFLLSCILLIGYSTTASATVSSFYTSFQNLDKNQWYVSSGWANGDFQSCEWRDEAITVVDNHLQMELSDNGGKVRPLGCGELHTNVRYGYGLYEARLRTAAGSGLNTAFFTYVGPPNGVPEWDEIDFEFLGKDPHSVQINYYVNGKGGHEVIVPLGFDASAAFHNYAIEWTPLKITWYVDGKNVHETPAGAVLPHNPSSIYLSLWSGSNQMDGWLGTLHYAKPITADIEWIGYTAPDKTCQFPQSLSCK